MVIIGIASLLATVFRNPPENPEVKGKRLETIFYGTKEVGNLYDFAPDTNLSISRFVLRNPSNQLISQSDILSPIFIHFHGRGKILRAKVDTVIKGAADLELNFQNYPTDTCYLDIRYINNKTELALSFLGKEIKDPLPEIKGAIANGRVLPMRIYHKQSILGRVLIFLGAQFNLISIVVLLGICIVLYKNATFDKKLKILEENIIGTIHEPPPEAPPNVKAAVDAFYSGVDYIQTSGSLSTAANQWKEAIRLEPNMAEAYYNRGITLMNQGNLSEAEREIQKAISLRPDLIEYLEGLARIWYQQGRKKEAKILWKQALPYEEDEVEQAIIKDRLAEPD
jgi:tetratricopeptide (TPR) repeat protein